MAFFPYSAYEGLAWLRSAFVVAKSDSVSKNAGPKTQLDLRLFHAQIYLIRLSERGSHCANADTLDWSRAILTELARYTITFDPDPSIKTQVCCALSSDDVERSH